MGRAIIRRLAKPPHDRVSPYSGDMPTLVKDGLERIGITALLAAISTALVVTQNWDYYWVPILAAVLNGAKVLIAQHYGDPNTGGFVNVVSDEIHDGSNYIDHQVEEDPAATGDLPEDEFIQLGD